jgi:predicted transcriptional regulator
MNTNVLFRAFFFLLFLSGTCIITTAADNGGYVVTLHTGEYQEGAIVDGSGADANITFWSLPFRIKLSVLISMLIPSLAGFKYFPLILGKLFVSKRNTISQKIYSYIADNPGCLESEVARNLGIKRGTLRYHIGRLKSKDLIFTIRKGKITGIFNKVGTESIKQICSACI